MMNILRNLGISSAAPVDCSPQDPKENHLVFTDKDQEDDFTEICVRRMTYSEIVGDGVKGRTRVCARLPFNEPAVIESDYPHREYTPGPQVLSNELYWDIASEYDRPDRVTRRKGRPQIPGKVLSR